MKIIRRELVGLVLSALATAHPWSAMAEADGNENCLWVDQVCTQGFFMTQKRCLEMGYTLDGRVCQDVLVRNLDDCWRVGGSEKPIYDAKGERVRDLDPEGHQMCQVLTVPGGEGLPTSQEEQREMTGSSCERIGGRGLWDGTCSASAEHIVEQCLKLGGSPSTDGPPACEFKMGRGAISLCEESFEGEFGFNTSKRPPLRSVFERICKIGPDLAQNVTECGRLQGTWTGGRCVVPVADLPPAPQCFKIHPQDPEHNYRAEVSKQGCLVSDQQLNELNRSMSYYKWATGVNEPGLRWSANMPFVERVSVSTPSYSPQWWEKGGAAQSGLFNFMTRIFR